MKLLAHILVAVACLAAQRVGTVYAHPTMPCAHNGTAPTALAAVGTGRIDGPSSHRFMLPTAAVAAASASASVLPLAGNATHPCACVNHHDHDHDHGHHYHHHNGTASAAASATVTNTNAVEALTQLGDVVLGAAASVPAASASGASPSLVPPPPQPPAPMITPPPNATNACGMNKTVAERFVQTTYYSCVTRGTYTHCGWHEPILDASLPRSSAAGARIGGGDGNMWYLGLAVILAMLAL